ncbi:MAG: glycosyltransferase family 2 protein [Mycobacteriales bacterium]
MTPEPTISVVIPCLNEVRHLPRLLASIAMQTVQPTEVIVVDGGSTDGTREWLEAAARVGVRVIDNPERIVPVAMNRGITAATGELVARMDAHASYADDYLECLRRVLAERPAVAAAGGVYRMSGSGAWGEAIAAVLSRPVGLGGAAHRSGGPEGPVDHVGTGMYRRTALVEVDGFDPTMLANEDFELDHRLKLAGHTVWLTPRAEFTSFNRDRLGALRRQMWRYGWYKSRTLLMHPKSLRLRQLAPPSLIVGLVVLAAVDIPVGMAAGAGYVLLAGGAGMHAARADGASLWRAAATVPVVHFAWGAGLLAGLVVNSVAGRGVAPTAGAVRPSTLVDVSR